MHEFLRTRPHIVEDDHPVATDDNQAMILIRMEPRDEHMGALAAGKPQLCRGHVGDRLVEVGRAGGRYLVGLFPDQGQNHGNIVRGETPEDVLLAPDFPQVQPVRVEVLQAAQRALADQFPKLQKRRVVLQQMPDHQGPVGGFGQRAQGFRLRDLERQRFFDEDMLAGEQRFPRHGEMLFRRRRDGHAVNVRVAQYVDKRPVLGAVLFMQGGGGGLVAVEDRGQRAEVVKIPDQVTPPVAAAYDRDGRVGGRAARGRAVGVAVVGCLTGRRHVGHVSPLTHE